MTAPTTEMGTLNQRPGEMPMQQSRTTRPPTIWSSRGQSCLMAMACELGLASFHQAAPL